MGGGGGGGGRVVLQQQLSAFAVQKLLSFFSKKNISVLGYKVVK